MSSKSAEIKINGKDTIYSNYSPTIFSIKDQHGNKLKMYTRGSGDNSTIWGYDYTFNPLFAVFKEFYPDAKIKIKGIQCVLGFKVGKWFFYDKAGNCIKTMDFDEGYTFNLTDMVIYCKKHKIALDKPLNGYQTKIYKTNSPVGSRLWVIIYSNKSQIETVQLDGATGRVLKESEAPFPNDNF